MAVQAQYPSNVFWAGNNILEEFQQLQPPLRENLIGAYNHYAGQQILNGTVFSDPESELTCNVSGSKKRTRDNQMTLTQPQQLQQQQVSQFCFVNLPKVEVVVKTNSAAISTGLQLSYEENRAHESDGTSTSGRSAILSPPSLLSPLTQDLGSYLYNQNVEIDSLIRLQNEKLRSVLEQTRKRHCRSLLSILEEKFVKSLREKDISLENARRRNTELEQKVKQMSAENQIWFNVAMNNEAMVSSLKSSLEQIIFQNKTQNVEGVGDNDGIAIADDAQSCCYEGVVEDETNLTQKMIKENRVRKFRRSCKVCRENDVSVLILPCRHLCLCKDCEPKLYSCPICKSMKNASLQILMS